MEDHAVRGYARVCDVIPANAGCAFLTSMILEQVDPEMARTLAYYVTLGLDLVLVARLDKMAKFEKVISGAIGGFSSVFMYDGNTSGAQVEKDPAFDL